MVKADAYGLGLARIAPTLAAAGCRSFFVATVSEGAALRDIVNRAGATGDIFVLSGITANGAPACAAADLVPVLQTPAQIDAWAAYGRENGGRRAPVQCSPDP